MTQHITTRAIIKEDDKVLLLRRKGGNPSVDGLLELPGGKVDFGEDPTLALEREVGEELAVRLETVQLHTVLSYIDEDKEDKQYIIVVYLATLSPAHRKITLSAEHDKYLWKKMSEIQLNEVTKVTKLVLGIETQTIETDQKDAAEALTVEQLTTVNSDLESIIIYADGGSRGNPGPSASGFVIMSLNERVLFEGGEYLGVTTNNQAEYQAVRLGLEKALEFGAKKVQFRLDSLLVVNQMLGVYQIKSRDLWPIHANIKSLIKQFDTVTFTHVRREFNKRADAMVNKILDEHDTTSCS